MTRPERIDKGLYWDEAWSLVSGCTPVSAGCDNCWSAKETHMRANNPNEKVMARNEGLTEKGCFNGQIRLNHEFLDKPLRKKKPTVYAVWNDLFHEDVPDDFIFKAIRIMRDCEQHIFLVLTKRPGRMNQVIQKFQHLHPGWWRLPNVWLGVTAENQQAADERIPLLLQTPAAVRFISAEPLLGELNILPYLLTVGSQEPWPEERGIDWVGTGTESGPKRRPARIEWVCSLRDQCNNAGVLFFLKQMEVGGKLVKMPELDGKVWCEMPGR